MVLDYLICVEELWWCGCLWGIGGGGISFDCVCGLSYFMY